jgi:hypothetical protein
MQNLEKDRYQRYPQCGLLAHQEIEGANQRHPEGGFVRVKTLNTSAALYCIRCLAVFIDLKDKILELAEALGMAYESEKASSFARVLTPTCLVPSNSKKLSVVLRVRSC